MEDKRAMNLRIGRTIIQVRTVLVLHRKGDFHDKLLHMLSQIFNYTVICLHVVKGLKSG